MNGNTKNPLDLNGLTIPEIDFGPAVHKATIECEALEAECKEKYGDDWWCHYVEIICPTPDYDEDEKEINKCIFYGDVPSSRIRGSIEIVISMDNKYRKRLQELFGRFWKRHISHPANDPKVNQRLLKDALKTGKWKELPDELQAEYHKMKDV